MIYLLSLGVAVFGLLIFALKSDRGYNSIHARNPSQSRVFHQLLNPGVKKSNVTA